MFLAVQFSGGNRRLRRITRGQFYYLSNNRLAGFSIVRRINSRMIFVAGDGEIPTSPEDGLWRMTYDIVPAPDQFATLGRAFRDTVNPQVGLFSPEPVPPLRGADFFSAPSVLIVTLEAAAGLLPFYGQGAPAASLKAYENGVLVYETILTGSARRWLGTDLTSLNGRDETPLPGFRFLSGVAYNVLLEELPQ